MWQVRLKILSPRPLALARMRFAVGASSIKIVETFNSSISAPSLCSAFAIAESNTFLTKSAALFPYPRQNHNKQFPRVQSL